MGELAFFGRVCALIRIEHEQGVMACFERVVDAVSGSGP
jgi:hypothetical protein